MQETDRGSGRPHSLFLNLGIYKILRIFSRLHPYFPFSLALCSKCVFDKRKKKVVLNCYISNMSEKLPNVVQYNIKLVDDLCRDKIWWWLLWTWRKLLFPEFTIKSFEWMPNMLIYVFLTRYLVSWISLLILSPGWEYFAFSQNYKLLREKIFESNWVSEKCLSQKLKIKVISWSITNPIFQMVTTPLPLPPTSWKKGLKTLCLFCDYA